MTGFNDWIEVFQGGPQRDSSGKTHDGDALIDKAVSTFDAAYHEPPAVIGHPKTDDPAFGLVSAVKAETRDGKKVLMARFRDVLPEFEDMVKTGRFPKRSAAFYADGRLRHVGFLGAMPPAVKGLQNIRFASGADGATFEFQCGPEGSKKEAGMNFAEALEFLKFWESVKKPAPAEPAKGNATPATFSEADLEAAKKAAGEAARKQAEAEFAEQRRKGALEARQAETVKFIDGLIHDGKIPPSWKDAGLAAFMESLPDGEIAFSEAKKQTPADWFRDFLTGFGKAPLFSEIAAKEKAGDGGQFAEDKKDAERAARIAAKAGAKKEG